MADLTFKGTTQQVLWEIANGSKIDKNTKVTINDNNYTLANLLTVINADSGLNYKVVLEKTSAAFELSGDKTNILKMLAGVNNYTGPLTVTDGTAGYSISATDLNKIAAGTTGKVTATIDGSEDIDQTLVSALQDVKTSDNITFKPADNTLTNNAEISALISLSKILPKADFSAIDTIEGSANDVAVIKQALAILKNNAAVAVEITGSINAADINAISKATKGVLTADIRDGSIKATLSALKDIDQNVKADKLTFKSTDTTASAKDMVALAAKTDDEANFDFTSVKTITADAKDAVSVVNALGLTTINSAPEIKISGNVELADITSIITASNSAGGKVIANVKAGTDADLAAAITSGAGNNVLNLTVTGATATATTLLTLDGKTAGTIAVEATTISGNTADLVTLYTNAANTFTKLGNESVIFTNSPSLTQLNTVAAATSGKVTATLAANTPIDSDTVTALSAVKASDNITFDSAATTIAGSELSTLLAIKKIIPNADFSLITSITAVNASDVALVKNAIKLVKSDATVAFTIGEISAADANTISKATSGAVTATIKDGSVAATLKALSDIDGTLDDLTFKTTDTTAKASDLAALAAKFNDITQFNVINVKTVTGNAADADDIADALTYLTAAASGTKTTVEVKISGNVAADEINDIITGTNGKVTATLKAATAAELVTALTDDITVPVQNNTINVTVNDTIVDALHLSKTNGISGLTSGKIKVDSLEVGGTFAHLNELYITNKSQFTNLGNEKVEITGGPDSALNVDAIAKATSGILTATVTGAAANVLVSQLKNANAKDALTITVINPTVGDTSAKDLLTLDDKTSVDLVVNTLTSISGTAADVKKVYESAGIGAFSTTETVTLSGTVKAADANAIAKLAGGAVSANVAADTAAKLLVALDDAVATDKLNLTVNGSTAAAADLISLNAKTTVDVQVDAKEVTGTIAQLGTAGTGLYALTTGFKGLADKNVKVTDTVAAATDAGLLSTILVETKGVVTATANGTVANLLTIANATSGKDALTLNIITDISATASDLLALDAKTSVKVDATALSVSGTAAQLKELAAAKGVQLAKDVALTVTGATNAADLAAVLKATTGKVTANVAADTASALNSALKDANSSDALTLTVNGATAAAKDLISLDGKTYVKIKLTVGEITGNIAEITNVFVTNAAGFDATLGASKATISGTVEAAAADKIADATTGVVTATIKADTAAVLNAALVDDSGTPTVNAYKLTVTGASAKAADLNSLDTKTSVVVDASAIKNIDGTIPAGAVEVNKVVTAAQAGQITGLGNETVNLTGATDANATLVKAINDFTTGLITLPTITFDKAATSAETFTLGSSLGDLGGITGLVKLDATQTAVQADIINIKLSDLIAANDATSGTINLAVLGDTGNGDTLNITNDLGAGWTTANSNTVGTNQTITYTNSGSGLTSIVITMDAGTTVLL